METEAEAHTQDMEKEEVEEEILEEDYYELKNTPNTGTEPKAPQQ